MPDLGRNAGEELAEARRRELMSRAERVGKDVAAKHADAVDRDARFPAEGIEALRQAKLLGAFVPVELGGLGCSIADLCAMCTTLGRHCSATAMIFAMHQIQVACIVRHLADSEALRGYLRELCDRQLLIASATSEVGIGGDTRTSNCGVQTLAGGRFALEKMASVISYGEHTDDILVTARRSMEAAASDQALVLVRKGEYTLERLGAWDTLGMRGTCSLGFKLVSTGAQSQVLPVLFADISSQSMLPISHLVWTSIWLGLATEATSRARQYIRAEARKKPGTTPPSAQRLAELVSQLHVMRSTVHDALSEYERRSADPESLGELAFAIRMNNLKIAASEQVVPIVAKALSICGISAYRNDTAYSLGRYLRDAYGAGVMILNDRLYGTNAALLLVSKED
jgi:acyl-CoA dehydrogenase